MNRLTQSFSHFLNSFLSTCLLIFALAALLVGANLAVSKVLAGF